MNDLDLYAREDIDRTSTKLVTMHDRMKAHLADLLRPALTDDTAHGQGSFVDGGEQFVGGDFAGDLDEDFFGFRELGLDKEFGMASLTVPFHILQNRLGIHNQTVGPVESGEKTFKEPARWTKINVENVEEQIGLARGWFVRRLRDNGDRPLMEDLELPLKQRPGYGRPRIPASGKIGEGTLKNNNTSPQKKGPAKGGGNANKGAGPSGTNATPGKKKASNVASGVNDETPVMNGAGNANPTTPGPGGDGSPEKKVKPMMKARTGTTEITKAAAAEKDEPVPPVTDLIVDDMLEDDPIEINGVGGRKVNGHVDGDASMMSPESL